VQSRTVRIEYYAAFREQRGAAQEDVETSAATALELYAELSAKHAFPWAAEKLRVAINDEFGAWTAPLAAGDRLVFIAPVAGG
jgi:molybdopterin converting factor small subunit